MGEFSAPKLHPDPILALELWWGVIGAMKERAVCQELSLKTDLTFIACALAVALSCCGFCLQV